MSDRALTAVEMSLCGHQVAAESDAVADGLYGLFAVVAGHGAFIQPVGVIPHEAAGLAEYGSQIIPA